MIEKVTFWFNYIFDLFLSTNPIYYILQEIPNTSSMDILSTSTFVLVAKRTLVLAMALLKRTVIAIATCQFGPLMTD